MSTDFRDIPMPARIAALPRDKHGHPVPWFVAWIDDKPDFRLLGPDRITDALRFQSCWICGQHIGATAAFVIGPMCAITRTAPEPPSHRDCAIYAARACPFLAHPAMRRRETGLPDGHTDPAGITIRRNPGVALVWTTRTWHTYRVHNGLLFNIGNPIQALWYAEGRDATRTEVLASIQTGLPLLRAEAESDPRPARALADLDRMHAAALAHIPTHTTTKEPDRA